MSARNDGVDGNVVADGGVLHVSADLDDFADKFMAYDAGISGEGVFAVINAYVGAADTGCFDLEQDLGAGDFRNVTFYDGNLFRCFYYDSFHNCISSLNDIYFTYLTNVLRTAWGPAMSSSK